MVRRRKHFRITLRRGNPTRKRRGRRKHARITSVAKVYRPRLYKLRGRWRRSKRSRLFRRAGPVMINPRYSRRRGRRHNPAIVRSLRSAFSRQWLMQSATIGGGIALGALGLPIVNRLIPSANRAQMRPYFGVFHILLGSLIAGFGRRSYIKTLGVTIAGVGAYDLISQNVSQLGLPLLPDSSSLIDKVLPMSASYMPRRSYRAISPATAIAASYRPSLAASYTPGGIKSTGLSADPMFEGISW